MSIVVHRSWCMLQLRMCVELFPEINRYGLSEVKSMEMDQNDRIIYPELLKITIKNPDYPRFFVYKYIQNHPDHGILSGIG